MHRNRGEGTKYLMNTTIGQNLLIQIGEVVVYGSRCRGTEKTDSDIDIVFEYRGDICEDDLFNLFHEDGFSVGIHKIDINPIKEDKSGNIAEFLQQATIYMESEWRFLLQIGTFISRMQRKGMTIPFMDWI